MHTYKLRITIYIILTIIKELFFDNSKFKCFQRDCKFETFILLPNIVQHKETYFL